MNKRIARVATLLAMVLWSWIAPQPAQAQLLPPLPIGGSLIVAVTSPASGSTVTGTVPVAASVSIVGALTVRGVQFKLDGNNLGAEVRTAPYSVPWTTTNSSNGSHTLAAVATDVVGVAWTSDPVTVRVANPPTVTINQAAGQANPTNAPLINFTAVFSVPVSGFSGAGVTISGTAGGTKAVTVSGGPSTYSVAVSGMTTDGTVIASIPAGVAQDAAGVTNTASTSTSNSVTFNGTRPTVTIDKAASQADPTSTSPINFTAVFSKPVSGFSGAGVTISGTAGGSKTATVSGGPSTYNVAVSGMTSSGTVIATIPAGVAQDAAGNLNTASTSTNNSVTFSFVSPVVLENQQPGSGNWQMLLSGFQPADDVNQQIKGYASATSVNLGESITFYVTVNPAQNYTMDVYRMGWYQGLLGRLMQSIPPLQGVAQPACPADASTGLIECNWTASYTLTVPATWTSGVFVVMLTNAQGYQNYIPFVVRDDARVADIMFQQSVATYQAYNNYPDDRVTGKSLYAYNSYGGNTVAGTPRAVKVSWNRPYAGRGAGQLLEWEVYFVRWLERSGYDVKYSTNVDTHENSARLLQSKAFLSVGHDGYWSKPMYDGAQQARDAGVHLGFFGAGAVFSQVRFEASPLTGAADRVMVYYKDRTIDPVQGPTTTILWRDPFLNRPEQQLIGVQFTGEIAYDPMNQPPYVVANSSSWVYAGTGLADGTSIPRILGYQMDASMSSFPLPTSVAGTNQILSQSPFTDSGGATVTANSSIYQAPSGAWVFGAGTTSWAWGLVDDGDGFVDPRIQQTTANLLQRFGASPSP
jgi:predicted Zn-dependent protease